MAYKKEEVEVEANKKEVLTKYKIIAEEGIKKQLQKLPLKDAEKIKSKIRDLAENPRPRGVKKLKSYTSVYRIRIGDYRVIYEIIDKELTILILKVGNRKDIY